MIRQKLEVAFGDHAFRVEVAVRSSRDNLITIMRKEKRIREIVPERTGGHNIAYCQRPYLLNKHNPVARAFSEVLTCNQIVSIPKDAFFERGRRIFGQRLLPTPRTSAAVTCYSMLIRLGANP